MPFDSRPAWLGVFVFASMLPAQRYEWRRVTPPVAPSARSQHTMAYDSTRHVTLLFGGTDTTTSQLLGDTWQYDGVTWTELHPPHAPPARKNATMAFDPLRERIVLISGANFTPTRLRDTWEWDGQDWTQVASNVAALDIRGGACFDPRLGGVLYSVGSDNLLWDGGAWHALRSSSPSLGNQVAMVYDATHAGPLACVLANQQLATRRFDPVAGWQDVFQPIPLALSRCAVAADPRSGRMALAGGIASSYLGTGTWVNEGSGWFRLTQELDGRVDAQLVFDLARDAFVLFGGRFEGASPHAWDDTWELHVVDVQATYAPFGTGCGQPAAQLGVDPLFSRAPIVGGALTMRATGLAPQQPAVHVVGSSDSLWSGIQLPFDLAVIGAPGCALLVAPEILDSVGSSDAAGTLRFSIVVPDDLSLVGVTYFDQVLGLAPGANAAGLRVTNGGVGVIGTR